MEHAVAANNTSANSSIRFQFSGPFIPLPADTIISASANETLPLETSCPFIVMLPSFTDSTFSIWQFSEFSIISNALGAKVIIAISL